MEQTIPYKIYLEEQEMPKQWYNVRADMKKKPAPILNPQTLKPVTVDELSAIFCTELAKQELDDTTPYFDIPQEIRVDRFGYQQGRHDDDALRRLFPR